MKLLVIGDLQGIFPAKLKSRLKKEEFDLVVGVGDYAGISDFRPYFMKFFREIKKGKKNLITPEEYFGKKKLEKLEKKNIEAGKKVLKDLNSLGKPVILIFGNTDDEFYNYPFQKGISKPLKSMARFIRGLKNVRVFTYKNIKQNGFYFSGLGGYIDPDKFLREKRNREDKQRMKNLLKRRKESKRKLFDNLERIKRQTDKILVLHYPPKGVFDIIKEKNNPFKGDSVGTKYFNEAIKKYKPRFVLCGHMHEYRGVKKVYGIPVINPGDGEFGKAAIIEVLKDSKKIKVKFIS